MVLSLLSGCAVSVIEEYEVARTLALSDPGQAPENWTPDATIQLSQPLLDTLITTALTPPPTFTGQIAAGPLTLSPQLQVQHLKVGAAKACTECLQIDLDIGGSVGWSTFLGSGTASATIGSRLDTALSITPSENGFVIGTVPRAIHDVHVTLAGMKTGVDLSGAVASFVQTTVLSNLPAIPLTEVGTETAPVRGIRVTSQHEVIRVDLLSGARVPGAVPPEVATPADGFSVDVSLDSLLAIARAEAFKAGAMSMGLLAEPTQLSFEGDRFTVGLRLWKTTGNGFWRDYEITGTYGMDGENLVMKPENIEDKGHSRGAAIADPLLAMTEGIIQSAIKSALNTTVPTSSGKMGDMGVEIVVTELTGQAGVLRAVGTVRFPDGTTAQRASP